MAMEEVRPRNVHVITTSSVVSISVGSNAATTATTNFFLGSDVPIGVASDCIFYLKATQSLVAQSVTISPALFARWHNADASSRTEVSAFTHPYSQGYVFAAVASFSFSTNASSQVYFPATSGSENQNVRFHPPYGGLQVLMTASNSATGTITHQHTLFAAFMIQGR